MLDSLTLWEKEFKVGNNKSTVANNSSGENREQDKKSIPLHQKFNEDV